MADGVKGWGEQRVWDQVSDEANGLIWGMGGDDHGSGDGVDGEESVYDFGGFDAEAADFDLGIAAMDEFDVAVREAADDIAGAVEAVARREGVRDEG